MSLSRAAAREEILGKERDHDACCSAQAEMLARPVERGRATSIT